MISKRIRAAAVAILAALLLYPALASRMEAPANYGAHQLTTGFGRGRLDVPGIVSLGTGGRIDLPDEPLRATLRLTGDGPVRITARGVDRTVAARDTPLDVSLALEQGGPVAVESQARVRLLSVTLERSPRSASEVGLLILLGVGAIAVSLRGARAALGAALVLVVATWALFSTSLTDVFLRILLVQLQPWVVAGFLLLPLGLALRRARFPFHPMSFGTPGLAFLSSLAVSGLQLVLFEQPLLIGDPASYFDMGGRFADAFLSVVVSPLRLGPALTDLQPYLALPATGLVYGLIRCFGDLTAIRVLEALAVAVSVSALVSICETGIGPRAARIAWVLALIHPTFSILPGIVQPEPFILAAWTLGALAASRSLGDPVDVNGLLAAGLLLGAGLALHPQGLSFLLLAIALCLVPWARGLARNRAGVLALLFGTASVLLPVAAAERFSKPLAYVLDKQYGFFAYTSPHPLGFWLYVDSQGWQGPLRIDDTTYQKELKALKGEAAVSSSFADVGAFVARHAVPSAHAVLTNLHRLWHQPDNPFAVSYPIPYAAQIPLQRGLLVLFVLSLPILLGGRLAVLALPFAMLSMTYPAYHVFNKYATPALPFTIIGAALVLDRLWTEGRKRRVLLIGLAIAALGAQLPAHVFAELGVPGGTFLALARSLVWVGLSMALVGAIRAFGVDARSKALSGVIGVIVLIGASVAASQGDALRGSWSVALDRPFEVDCTVNPAVATASADPAWILIDAEASQGFPPSIEVNGRTLDAAVPTMPTFGLATVRGHRAPATFRQIWRSPVTDDLLAGGALKIRLGGGALIRVFGDVRSGVDGPRLSLGDWPYLSVYRLMHEGQYRLNAASVPPQACEAQGIGGRPGVSLVRIPKGAEGELGSRGGGGLTWVF